MGKPFWRRQRDDDDEEVEDNNPQPGCMWGLVHALKYHHWHSNVRKMRRHLKYEPLMTPKSSAGGLSPISRMSTPDAYEVEKLTDETENPNIETKRPRSSNKRSLKSRIKALISEEISKGSDNNKRSLKSRIKALISEEISKGSNKLKHGKGFSLQRTYSVHHLESLDGKLDKNQVILFPRNVENCTDQSLETSQSDTSKNEESGKSSDKEYDTDVLGIFKVDKELFVKNLQDSMNAKFTKSRSYPVAGLSYKRKFKPSKLEDKQREVWSFPEEDRFRGVDRARRLSRSVYFGARFNERYMIKRTHHKTSSSNESLEKYAQLFEKSRRANVKLDFSKSLKLPTEEYGYRSMYFGRIYSLSFVDSYYSDLNFGELDDDNSVNGSSLADAEDSSLVPQISQEEEVIDIPLVNGRENVSSDETWTAKFPENRLDGCHDMKITEESAGLRLTKSDDDGKKLEKVEEGAEKPETNFEGRMPKELLEYFVMDSDIILQEKEIRSRDFHVSEGLEHRFSHSDELDSSTNSNTSTLNLYNEKRSDKNFTCFEHDECHKNRNPDLCYIRHFLDQSGISTTTSERTLQESDHPLTPQFFEEFEARWPHDRDQLTGWPDFHGCWHHMMLFHVANEAVHSIYDISRPYYTKALSLSFLVHPFPVGNHFIEAICTKIGTFVPEEKQSLDCIVAHDLANDDVWMNLQYESECIALELEDIIFDEILEEFICS